MTQHAANGLSHDPGLSWSQLRAFDACSRLASFRSAAVALNISASAVRFQVGLLEARLAVRLFERQDGRLVPTAVGEALARQIARPMRELLAACAAATQAGADAPMTLTAPPLFARHLLLGRPFLKWCEAHHIRLDIADTKRDLLSAAPIAAVRLDAGPEAGLTMIPLMPVSVCAAAIPSVAAGARPADPSWWSAQTLLCPSAGKDGWALLWQALGIGGQCHPPMLTFASYAAAMASACDGHGLVLAPLPFAQDALDTRRLMAISPVRIAADGGYSLVMRDTLAASKRGRLIARKLSQLCAVSVAGSERSGR